MIGSFPGWFLWFFQQISSRRLFFFLIWHQTACEQVQCILPSSFHHQTRRQCPLKFTFVWTLNILISLNFTFFNDHKRWIRFNPKIIASFLVGIAIKIAHLDFSTVIAHCFADFYPLWSEILANLTSEAKKNNCSNSTSLKFAAATFFWHSQAGIKTNEIFSISWCKSVEKVVII